MIGSWQRGLAALRQDGVRLVGPDGSETTYPVAVACEPGECCQPSNYALVLVKSWATRRVAETIAGCLAPEGLALTLQNGLGNCETLAERLGEGHVALGVTTYGATLLGPGQVRPAGVGKVFLTTHPHLEPLAEILRSAGFQVEFETDPRALIWGKLLVSAAINPLTTLLQVPNGELLRRPAARQLMRAAVQEVVDVAHAQGIQLKDSDPVAMVEAVARRTAENLSSMLQDRQRGAPTEIDAICGAIVEVGARFGTPTPVNWTLWQAVKAIGLEENLDDKKDGPYASGRKN
jgi:2-dehydropantoate 2-reductase